MQLFDFPLSWLIRIGQDGLFQILCLNLLSPNANYSGRNATLSSKVAFYIFIQQI